MALKRQLPLAGTLFISGAGKIPELRPRFVESVGGREARIVNIPSHNDLSGWPFCPEFGDVGICEQNIEDEDFESRWNWSVQWVGQLGVTNAAVLHTADREVANSDEFCRHIREADGIFFTGGTASKVVPTYKDTKAHEEFIALLDRGGSIAGFSAGAMLQGAWTADTEVDPTIQGLGFLPDVAILTHFLVWNTQFFMPKIIEEHPECLGVGLDERAAIVVRGDEFEVIGSSYVALYDYNKILLPDGKFYLIAPGDRFSLATRKVLGEPKTYLKQLVDCKWSEIDGRGDSEVGELMRSQAKGE